MIAPATASSAQAQLTDSFIKRGFELERIRDTEAAVAVEGAEETHDKIIAAVLAFWITQKLRGRRGILTAGFRRLRGRIRDLSRDWERAERERGRSALLGIADARARLHASDLADAWPVDVDVAVPTRRDLRSSLSGPVFGEGLSHAERVRDAARQMEREAVRAVTISVVGDESTADMQARLGVGLEKNGRGVETMATTVVQAADQQASEDTALLNTQMVKAWISIATLDHRTTALCWSLHGTIWPLGGGWRPPRHPRCRTVASWVLVTAEELSPGQQRRLDDDQRRTLRPSPPNVQTAEAWLRGQPVEVQNAILGARKAQLWRRGDLRGVPLIRANGTPFTVAELEAAAERSGRRRRLSPVTRAEAAARGRGPGHEARVLFDQLRGARGQERRRIRRRLERLGFSV